MHHVDSFWRVAPFTLRVRFDDGHSQVIDFRPVLKGELFGPLRDRALFDQVALDQEARTLVWPNGADFDPATLYHWADRGPQLAELAATWTPARAHEGRR
ncbi:MAG: DUF2442 domain-containing protein [Gammaproteobacteria bacterium]|nr:DUF2442 domain-containing protein [Gammaproteobacteria bacterium]